MLYPISLQGDTSFTLILGNDRWIYRVDVNLDFIIICVTMPGQNGAVGEKT